MAHGTPWIVVLGPEAGVARHRRVHRSDRARPRGGNAPPGGQSSRDLDRAGPDGRRAGRRPADGHPRRPAPDRREGVPPGLPPGPGRGRPRARPGRGRPTGRRGRAGSRDARPPGGGHAPRGSSGDSRRVSRRPDDRPAGARGDAASAAAERELLEASDLPRRGLVAALGREGDLGDVEVPVRVHAPRRAGR